MSESRKSEFCLGGEANKNNSSAIDDSLHDDSSAHEALIRDLTSENVIFDDEVLCRNDRTQDSPASNDRPAGNVVAGDTRKFSFNKTVADSMPHKNKACPSSITMPDKLDHDYTAVRQANIEKSLKILDRKDCTIVKSNTVSLLRASKQKPQQKEESAAQVKNISELKKVTPRVKLLTGETKLSKVNSDNKSSGDVTREQLKKYCRTCAGLKVPLVDIFSDKGIQMRLNQQMKHLKDISEHDGLSTQMCMDCICDLKMSYKFFMQIKKAQVKLQSISAALQANGTTNLRTSDEIETSQPIATISLTDNPDSTTYTAKKSENEKPKKFARLSGHLKKLGEPTTTRTTDQSEIRIKLEPEVVEPYASNPSDDTDDSIEEFDPDDPSFQLDHAESEADIPPEIVKNLRIDHHRRIQNIQREISNRIAGKTSQQNDKGETPIEQKLETGKDPNKTVYQYDSKLKAYIKVEPPDDKSAKCKEKINTALSKKRSLDSDAGTDVVKKPNILKRKITAPKDFLGKPVACARQSDSAYVRAGPRDMKKPKLDVKNALTVDSEKEDGIMYVTVKGTKPNELLLVKVKKMDKTSDSKKEEKKKVGDAAPVENIAKKLESSIKKEAENEAERSKILDAREQEIAEQIEEYKKKREKILGGTASVPNALKFEDGMIRFVNPVENTPDPVVEPVRVKAEPKEEENVDVRHVTASPEMIVENDEKNDIKSEDTDAYDNTGEYLTRLARLKRKWEKAKRKKEMLKRELEESYGEDNMDKLTRILGEREKNLADFHDYLKQRKIVITRLKDEDVISLYEDRNNATARKNFPDLIDETTPIDYIAEENYLECDYCPETFAQRDLLEEHLKTHDYKLMYWCEDCHLEFPTVKSKRAHNGGCMKKLTCRYCELVLDSKGKKRQHEQKHVDSMYGQICDVCGEKFKHQTTLDQHFKTQHMTWEKIYQCTKCPKKFAFKQKLTFHLKSVHTTLRAWLCEDCGADFKNPASLRHHRIRKHHPTGNKRECPVCHKLVPFYSLSKHMYTHKAYTIQCPHCDKMFKNSSTLKQHVRIHEDQRQHRCDTCGVGFNRRDGLRLHMRVHQKSDSRALKECSCQICSEKFPNHSMLVIHRNRVHKDGRQYTCHICNRSMLSTRSLEWHMSHIHNETLPGDDKPEIDMPTEKKRVSCVHCDKTFKTEMILRTHIKNTHIEKNPTKCLDCEQAFTSDVRLRHHMMVAHNRLEGTLTCPHCPKRFVNQLRLKTHMISHSEERPYTCEICGFNLKTKIQLIKHHQNRHSDERPLQCRYCPWRCKQVSALVCHERTHTNERPYSCMVCRQRFKYLGDKNKHERRHESLGGSGFKRIVAGRNVKPTKVEIEETSNSEQEQIDYDNQDEEQQYEEQQDDEYNDDKYTEEEIVKFESEEMGEEYQEEYEQEYEETSREASEAAEVIMNMEDTTVYTEEVTADNSEQPEMISDETIENDMSQPEITVVHLQQQDDNGKIQVIPVMLSLPDLSDSSAEVNLATASIMYNN